MQLDRLSATWKGPAAPWLDAVRKAATERFDGLPSSRVEEWKYTSTRALGDLALAHGSGDAEVDADLRLNGAAAELVFVNGVYRAELSRQIDGVAVLSADPEAARPQLEQVADEGAKDAFVTLNAAFVQDGAVVSGSAEGTVHLLFLTTGDHVASHVRNVIVAAPNTRVRLLETHAGDGLGLDNTVTTIDIGEGATVEHHLWHRDGSHRVHRVEATVGRNGRFVGHIANLGGAWVRTDHHVSLNGPGAEMSLSGLYLVDGEQHVDNHTRIDHTVPHTTSRETYRGVVGGHGRAVFNGAIVVHKDAQQTDGALSNHNLLLSDDARVDTKPELEIYADDVKCSHGTTIGQLDEEALFYARTRGISEGDARGMLIAGFVREMVEAIEHDGLRLRLGALVDARLDEVQQ